VKGALSTAIVVLLCSGAARADPEEHFRRGLEAFEGAARYWKEHPSDRPGVSQRYLEAARAFVAVWEEGVISAEVFTNAANSFYFAGEIGQAVLFYRRALAADPGNRAARQGLEHARGTLPIAPPRSSATLADSLFFWHREENFHLRRLLFSVLFPSAWVLFAVEVLRSRGRRRERRTWTGPFALLGYLCLAVSLAFLASLAHEALARDPKAAAVVMAGVEGRTGPGEQYQRSHARKGAIDEPLRFPPGTEVRIIGEAGTSAGRWLHVELLDGSQSFVPAETVERVIVERVD
jgi:hypothetical protein